MDQYFWKKSIIRQIEQWNIGCMVGNKKMGAVLWDNTGYGGFCKTDSLWL